MTIRKPLPVDNGEGLLRSILKNIDDSVDVAGDDSIGPHLDDDIMALFAAGGACGVDRDETIHHLSQCSACRRTASLLMELDETQSTPAVCKERQRARSRRIPGILAMAASVIVLLGLVYSWPQKERNLALLEQNAYENARELVIRGQFGNARHVIEAAYLKDVHSDRLLSLKSQAIREIPDTTALAAMGRLSDFGYGIGGVVARDTSNQKTGNSVREGLAALAGAGTEDQSVILNRGHSLLQLGITDGALAEFSLAVNKNPKDPMAHLGVGLASFMLNDFEAAAESFRRCRELDPGNVEATINLAMTLEEQDQIPDAFELWQTLAVEELPVTERDTIRQHMDELKQNLNK